jgi:hypothetical protein
VGWNRLLTTSSGVKAIAVTSTTFFNHLFNVERSPRLLHVHPHGATEPP